MNNIFESWFYEAAGEKSRKEYWKNLSAESAVSEVFNDIKFYNSDCGTDHEFAHITEIDIYLMLDERLAE